MEGKDYIRSIVERHDTGVKISGEELRKLVWDSPCVVEREEGENGRWTRTIYIVFEFENRYFEYEYEEGLTENQEDEYYDSVLTEVKPVKKTIEVTEWEEI